MNYMKYNNCLYIDLKNLKKFKNHKHHKHNTQLILNYLFFMRYS